MRSARTRRIAAGASLKDVELRRLAEMSDEDLRRLGERVAAKVASDLEGSDAGALGNDNEYGLTQDELVVRNKHLDISEDAIRR